MDLDPMDLDPLVNTSQDENTYSDYDDRPIRPMDQDALNEALARLPILIDEDNSNTTYVLIFYFVVSRHT